METPLRLGDDLMTDNDPLFPEKSDSEVESLLEKEINHLQSTLETILEKESDDGDGDSTLAEEDTDGYGVVGTEEDDEADDSELKPTSSSSSLEKRQGQEDVTDLSENARRALSLVDEIIDILTKDTSQSYQQTHIDRTNSVKQHRQNPSQTDSPSSTEHQSHPKSELFNRIDDVLTHKYKDPDKRKEKPQPSASNDDKVQSERTPSKSPSPKAYGSD